MQWTGTSKRQIGCLRVVTIHDLQQSIGSRTCRQEKFCARPLDQITEMDTRRAVGEKGEVFQGAADWVQVVVCIKSAQFSIT